MTAGFKQWNAILVYVVLNFKYQAEKFEVVVIVEINCIDQGHCRFGVFFDNSCDDDTVQNDVALSPWALSDEEEWGVQSPVKFFDSHCYGMEF